MYPYCTQASLHPNCTLTPLYPDFILLNSNLTEPKLYIPKLHPYCTQTSLYPNWTLDSTALHIYMNVYLISFQIHFTPKCPVLTLTQSGALNGMTLYVHLQIHFTPKSPVLPAAQCKTAWQVPIPGVLNSTWPGWTWVGVGTVRAQPLQPDSQGHDTLSVSVLATVHRQIFGRLNQEKLYIFTSMI